jgi:hypothetical protein
MVAIYHANTRIYETSGTFDHARLTRNIRAIDQTIYIRDASTLNR